MYGFCTIYLNVILMSGGLLLFLVALGAVALFVVGMSLTLIIKGHHIDSEIATNKHMQERGIRCTSQQMREEEYVLQGGDVSDLCNLSCAGCHTACANGDSASEKTV